MRYREAVQRTERAATRLPRVRLLRVGHRAIGHERDNGVDLRVYALDARDVRRHHVARRHLLATDSRGEIDRSEIAQLVARNRAGVCALVGWR